MSDDLEDIRQEFTEYLDKLLDIARKWTPAGTEQAGTVNRLIEAGMWFARGSDMYRGEYVPDVLRSADPRPKKPDWQRLE